MHNFESASIRVQEREIQQVSMSTTSPKIIFKDQPKVRHPLPFTSARALIKRMGDTGRPLFDVPVSVMYYNDKIVAVECKDYKVPDPDKRVIVNIAKNVRVLSALTGSWMWDGQNVYRPNHSDIQVSSNVKLIGYDVYDTHKAAKSPLEPRKKYGIQYTSSCGTNQYTSPPVMAIESQLAQWCSIAAGNLARIDNLWTVNLRGVLFIAKNLEGCADISYEHLEPLKLPHHMVELQTLSLVTEETAVKYTTPAKLPASHMMIWLIGNMARVQHDIEQVRVVADCFERVFDSIGRNALMGFFAQGYFEQDVDGKKKGKTKNIHELVAIADSLPRIELPAMK